MSTSNSYLDADHAMDLHAQINNRIANIRKLYNEGTMLFSRDALRDLDQQLEEAKGFVIIRGMDGKLLRFDTRNNGNVAGHVRYRSIESLINLNPETSELVLCNHHNPLAISFYVPFEWQPPQHHPLDVERLLQRHHESWSQSDTCSSFKIMLSAAGIPDTIDKIVCFGLGSFRGQSKLLNGEPNTRSYWQHMAAKTMTAMLLSSDATEIPCYCQDPIYDEFDKSTLQHMGIVLLEDPKGFITVGSNTLVFSVSPNVPVKQIVCDVQWPAAMLWNTVRPVEENRSEWKKVKFEGDENEIWTAPYSTDPDSSRVRDMVAQYHAHSFLDHEDNFGKLTLYVRKAESMTASGSVIDQQLVREI